MLAVQLDEQPELRPREVDAGDDVALDVVDVHLPRGIRNTGPAGELDHECLEQALGRGGASRPERQYPADPSRGALLQVVERDGSLSERGLQRLLPSQVVELGGEVDQGLQRAGTAVAADNDNSFWAQHPTPDAVSAIARAWRHRHVGFRRSHPVEAVEQAGEPSAGYPFCCDDRG